MFLGTHVPTFLLVVDPGVGILNFRTYIASVLVNNAKLSTNGTSIGGLCSTLSSLLSA